MTALELRKRHPRFVYERYTHRFKSGNLEMRFRFTLEPNIVFQPNVVIRNVPASAKKIPKSVLDNLVFHLGLMEIPSYWKCAVSPEIVVKAGSFDARQIAFWKDLLLNGLGEFFYRNRIHPYRENFLNITSERRAPLAVFKKRLPDRFLVPVGGGKDSLVTLEVLKRAKKEFRPFVLGEVPAALAAGRAGTRTPPVRVARTIDPKLLELNRAGYLNGHTPFSAYLAFLSVTCATLFDYRHVAASNERSSNEGNVRWHGRGVNHQYSKSFDFEKKFRAYAKKYLASSVDYFSILRSLYELQIASLFAQFPRYLNVFKSCNVFLKKNAWCGHCAKCVSVYLLLAPFVAEKKLAKALGRNFLNDAVNWRYIPAMLGLRGPRPFDCIGTKIETRAALCLAIKKYTKEKKKLPLILKRACNHMKLNCNDSKLKHVLSSWNRQNFAPRELAASLKKFLTKSG